MDLATRCQDLHTYLFLTPCTHVHASYFEAVRDCDTHTQMRAQTHDDRITDWETGFTSDYQRGIAALALSSDETRSGSASGHAGAEESLGRSLARSRATKTASPDRIKRL